MIASQNTDLVGTDNLGNLVIWGIWSSPGICNICRLMLANVGSVVPILSWRSQQPCELDTCEDEYTS